MLEDKVKINTARLARMVVCGITMWVVSKTIDHFLPDQDGVAASVLLFCVLVVAARGDRTLAVVASIFASLSFSYYFVETAGSFRITTVEGTVSFAAMVFTALMGSHLALRAQRRALEAEGRRNEMERLQQVGAGLVATATVREAAENAVRQIVNHFGGGAVLHIEGMPRAFQAGDTTPPSAVYSVNGASRLELYGLEPSREVQNALVHLTGLVLDRAAEAERRTRVESTQRGEELRNTVLNALAHNFRTPLTCIKAAASMMRGSADVHSGNPPAAYSRELVEVIDEEADRLDALIRDSLGMARIQAHQANPRFEPASIPSMIASILERMKRYLARQTVIVEMPEGLPLVRCDRFLFEQMVTQVLDNAWKYSGNGARIWITATYKEEIVLTIRNEGALIPEDEIAHVFDRFYRGARNRATVEGTGLGLAIAKTIAEAHGGRLWLENQTDGPAFHFAFPAAVHEEQDDREPHYIAD